MIAGEMKAALKMMRKGDDEIKEAHCKIMQDLSDEYVLTLEEQRRKISGLRFRFRRWLWMWKDRVSSAWCCLRGENREPDDWY